MKKRTAFIAALVSLLPLGQPLLIKIGVTFSSVGVTLFVSEKVNAESAVDFYKKGLKKFKETKDYEGAIEDFTNAINKRSSYLDAYYYRGVAKARLGDYESAIVDYSKVLKMNSRTTINRGTFVGYLPIDKR